MENHPCWWYVTMAILFTGFLSLIPIFIITQNNKKKKMIDQKYPDPPDPDFHKLLYQSGNTYLQEMKNSQWHITYLCALVFGAIIAITQLKIASDSILIEAHNNIKYLLLLLSLLVLFTNIYQITEHQFTIVRSRIAITKHDELFKFNHYWMTPNKLKDEKKKAEKLWHNGVILLVFFLPNIAGCFFVHYLLLWA